MTTLHSSTSGVDDDAEAADDAGRSGKAASPAQSNGAATRRVENPFEFTLTPELEASEPPEVRGRSRDDVRLMVSSQAAAGTAGEITHTRFPQIGAFLRAGDTLVINTSGVLNAALLASRPAGGQAPETLELHLSTRLPGGFWTIEPRLPGADGVASQPFRGDLTGETLSLPGGASATLHAPYPVGANPPRLWLATLRMPTPQVEWVDYLARYGFPIRYGYVRAAWPNSAYQTVYVTEMGSAEAPSAGRPFTAELMASLTAQGVIFAPLLLHTGVASLEAGEPPYEEYYRVSSATARQINATRAAGGRVIAVGTTSVRALETVADERGEVHPGAGWTGLVVTPERGVRAVDGLLTGLHEPRSSHLAMLAALACRDHLARAYAAALRERYLWHEFGDLHLILP